MQCSCFGWSQKAHIHTSYTLQCSCLRAHHTNSRYLFARKPIQLSLSRSTSPRRCYMTQLQYVRAAASDKFFLDDNVQSNECADLVVTQLFKLHSHMQRHSRHGLACRALWLARSECRLTIHVARRWPESIHEPSLYKRTRQTRCMATSSLRDGSRCRHR